MTFNDIKFDTSIPGEIPWEIVVAYFVIATALTFYFSRKVGFSKFTTIDLVYIGIGAAFSTVWEFYIGAFASRLVPHAPFISIGFWGRMIIIFIVAALVRKPGVGILTLFVFDVLADTFHYGFGGQPLYFIYESLTYGLFIDMMIVATRGKLFGVGMADGSVGVIRSPLLLTVIEGGILGALWATPDPLLYYGFLRAFIYGAVVNWGYILYLLSTTVPVNALVGVVGGLASSRVARAVGQ
ncbi:hypothetical protein [Stygiolobus caldivivus]|uniref:Uncharacterized protein n=1 Tax=Stygiolobus caldivivus TaxID=2824673 RepID=A0A8D5ZKM8_9CREN|nr:hypothetical protein [Stygiolobus caldivivus]BCU71550.1 hypothetical protein KN1_28470 [Stygiolobus caldivivus]